MSTNRKRLVGICLCFVSGALLAIIELTGHGSGELGRGLGIAAGMPAAFGIGAICGSYR